MNNFDRFAWWIAKPANCTKVMFAFGGFMFATLAMVAEGGILQGMGL